MPKRNLKRLILAAGFTWMLSPAGLMAAESGAQAAPSTTSSSTSTPSATLPLEVRIDLLREQLATYLRNDDNQGIVDLIPQFRSLDLEFPDNLYFLEGRALYRLGRALEAQDRLITYLRNTGRDGTYYDEATALLLAVKEQAAEQEKQRQEQERQRREELAKRAEKARMLRIREVQASLQQLGFRQAEETGVLNKPTREAIAVYQIRRDLTVSGDVTDETLEHLKSEVPKKHNCDTLAGYSRTPEEFGLPIGRIASQAAIPACNEALRLYPDVVRFQVEYARALLAAGRDQDARVAVDKAADKGYPEAQTLIAWMYENGRLTDNGRPDYDNAMRWYKLAAKDNYPEAQLSIGQLHYNGNGVRRDYDEAAQWYARAANQGYPPAQTALGELYMTGRGVDRDYGQALQWISRAAEAGYPEAQFQMGELYERGRGVK
ncbi:MAG: SEL1-like repeat protein, partial [Pseudomonadales bacterium]|nr:SEL1-like repeat protein [Pseudomonadales bacterium]